MLRTMEDLQPYDSYLEQLLADDPDIDAISMHRQLEQSQQETIAIAAVRKWHKETLAANVSTADLETFYGDWLRQIHSEMPAMGNHQLTRKLLGEKKRKTHKETMRRWLESSQREEQAPVLSQQECFDNYAD